MPYPDAGPRCPIAGCERGRGTGMLMCGPCWRRVPAALKGDVYTAWRARQRSPFDPHLAVAHESAKRAAIEAVEALG